MTNANVKEMSVRELYDLYYDWIDNSIYEGLDDDQVDELMEELDEKYGTSDVLLPDAPPEAVAAWKEDTRRKLEAAAQGYIID